jgi:hypothetical protein
MAKLRIRRDVLEQTKQRSNLTDDEAALVNELLALSDGKGPVSTEVQELPLAFLRALLDDTRLSPNQRAVVSMQVHGLSASRGDPQGVYETLVSSPTEFASTFTTLSGRAPNCEIFLNGRWYPVIVHAQFVQDERYVSKMVLLQAMLSFCECQHVVTYPVFNDLFMDETGQPVERTVIDVLQTFGFRRLQTSPAEFNLKLLRAERSAREQGKLVLVTGPALAYTPHWWGHRFESRAMGTREMPRRAIIEPELEVAEDQRHYYAPHSRNPYTPSRLPLVRIFSLDTKTYVYADVEDTAPYEFDEHAMGKLHLPAEMLGVLSRVFHTPVEQLFGDIIRGKHGGVVVLACGNPGVGKTLTAEVYAEQTERPLYVLELGELGTNVAQVEENLSRVFSRVARWNAVLQFDECEIFLAKRGDDLERSAIVGSFLRLLDYYRGILFLTTNRPEVLDHAVLSRVMLKLEYPDLDHAARAAIWKTMLASAGLTLSDGSLDELAQVVMNGRDIRNLTRLAKILYPGGTLTLEQMRGVLRYRCT